MKILDVDRQRFKLKSHECTNSIKFKKVYAQILKEAMKFFYSDMMG